MKTFVTGAACAILAAGAASAEDTIGWSEDVAGWTVAVDTTIGNSCFMLTAFENEFVVRLQFNRTRDNVQLIIGNMRWTSVKAGESYDMEVGFGDLPPWSGDAEGYVWSDTVPSLVLSIPVAEEKASYFLGEFMDTDALHVAHDGTRIADLALDGTAEAVAELISCQAEMLANAAPEDPFAGDDTASEPL
jgi:hypothetical protein